jgi:DNA polymerase-3 subunit gamma/tau
VENNYIVTARKWRPQTFDSVVGQEHITNTLKNAIKSNRIHHAYLFSGPRGVGKTTTARILARAVNCLSPIDYEPCNKCANCIAILENRSLDVIEIDGASNNSVEDVRKLRENAKYPPTNAKYKIYIIDEVHMLSNAAFNALLKILEEPPKHLIFIFATTEPHKVLPTITSRCQRYDFKRMDINSIVNQLRYISDNEGINIDDKSLRIIAQKGDGSMRDAQSIFDQVIAFCDKDITIDNLKDALHFVDTELYFTINKYIREKDYKAIFEISNDILLNGYDYGEVIEGLIEFYRNMSALKATNNPDLLDLTENDIQLMKNEIKDYTIEDLIRIINILIKTEQNLKNTSQPKIKFELALLQIISLAKTKNLDEIIEIINKIIENPKYQNFKDPISINLEKKIDEKNQLVEEKIEQTKKNNINNEKIETSKSKDLSENASSGNLDKKLYDLFGAIEIKE